LDVRLSAEQRALRDSAAQLVDRLGPKSVADLDDTDRRDKLEVALAGTGWRELRTADETGSPWAGTVEVALIVEELGRGLADVPFVGPVLATELRRVVGADPAEDPETVLLTSDLAELVRSASSRGVAVDAAGAISAVGLDADRRLVSAGLSGSSDVDLTRPARLVDGGLQDAGGSAADDAALTRWHAFGLALSCADLVGVMRGALELARGYACARHQYGAAVGSFQAVQHLLADAKVATEGSRSIARYAAWAVDRLEPDEALGATAAAKAYCARGARQVCETSIQVHGGIGNTWECLAHVYLRRALLSSDLLGNVGASLERVLACELAAAVGAA
jgi:alkylation response protein AidB-like acyl-CoA dehydrogenase